MTLFLKARPFEKGGLTLLSVDLIGKNPPSPPPKQTRSKTHEGLPSKVGLPSIDQPGVYTHPGTTIDVDLSGPPTYLQPGPHKIVGRQKYHPQKNQVACSCQATILGFDCSRQGARRTRKPSLTTVSPCLREAMGSTCYCPSKAQLAYASQA